MTSILHIDALLLGTIMAGSRELLLYIAIGATAIAVIQLILSLIGMDSDADFDVDGDTDLDFDGDHDGFLVGYLSVRNAVAFLAMFGWNALYCIDAGVGDPWAFLLSVGAGLVTTLLLQGMYYMFGKLVVDSTARSESAIGLIAEVYIPIPERGKGSGRVFVTLNNSRRELTAISSGPAFARSARVRVIALENGTLIVEAESASTMSSEEYLTR